MATTLFRSKFSPPNTKQKSGGCSGKNPDSPRFFMSILKISAYDEIKKNGSNAERPTPVEKCMQMNAFSNKNVSLDLQNLGKRICFDDSNILFLLQKEYTHKWLLGQLVFVASHLRFSTPTDVLFTHPQSLTLLRVNNIVERQKRNVMEAITTNPLYAFLAFLAFCLVAVMVVRGDTFIQSGNNNRLNTQDDLSQNKDEIVDTGKSKSNEKVGFWLAAIIARFVSFIKGF
jgi:hypothetical protein